MTGRVPCGQHYDQVVYQRLDVVAKLQADLKAQTPPKPVGA